MFATDKFANDYCAPDDLHLDKTEHPLHRKVNFTMTRFAHNPIG